jgi:hypothetical protein
MQRSTHDKPIGRRLVQRASGIKAVGMDESEGVTARPFLAPGYGVVTAVHFAGYIDGARFGALFSCPRRRRWTGPKVTHS